MSSPLANELTTPSAASPASTALLEQFALMYASGRSLESIAEKLGKPIRTLNVLMNTTQFARLLKECAQDTGAVQADKMIRGSAVDCVLTLVRLRDDSTVKADIRVRICMTLLDRAIGVPSNKPMSPLNNDLQEVLNRHAGATLSAAVDRDLGRLLAAHPELQVHQRGLVPAPKTLPTEAVSKAETEKEGMTA